MTDSILSGLNKRRADLLAEIKRTDAPKVTPSMRHALADLSLHDLFVAYSGADRNALGDAIHAVPLAELLTAGIDALLG